MKQKIGWGALLTSSVAALSLAGVRAQAGETGHATGLGRETRREHGGWPQWALDGRHSDQTRSVGQQLGRNIVNMVYDPLVAQEQAAAGGDLLAHYQVPLVDGQRVFMMFKDAPMGFDPNAYAAQSWGENGFEWRDGQLVKVWSFASDWKAPGSLSDFWEPVFHPALSAGKIYVPAAHGGLSVVDEQTGELLRTIAPFGTDETTFMVSPISVDPHGNLYYNALQLQAGSSDFFAEDAVDSWLVKVSARGRVQAVSYKTLVPNAPAASDTCIWSFTTAQPLPWPPAPDAVPAGDPCGTIRTALNIAPAIAEDGTIYGVARPHFFSGGASAFLVAIEPDLTPKWSASLSHLFHDGCGVPAEQGGQLPPNGQPGGCRQGAPLGVDPRTNAPGSGLVLDDSTASPVVAPDGSVLFGTWSGYNYAQGHLVHFSAHGEFLESYPFGWDITPALHAHGSTWSVVLKDNHYAGQSYCFDPTDTVSCPPDRTASNPAYPEAYFITQLDSHLQPEWRFRATNTESCTRNADDSVSCVSDHPTGFEWCVNAPVVDGRGIVYANSEDGWLYAIEQGGKLHGRIFQQLALGAAYTPTSIGPDGKIYSQNAGHLFVVAGHAGR